MDVSPNGRLVATGGSEDGFLRIFDVKTGNRVMEVDTGRSATYNLKFSGDGSYLVANHADSSLRLYDVHKGREVRVLIQNEPFLSSYATSPRGSLVAVPGTGGAISILDLKRRGEVSRIKMGRDSVKNVAFDPIGRWLAVTSTQGRLSIWDVRSGKLVHHFSYPAGGSGRVVWGRGGRGIVVAGGKQMIYRFGVGK